MVREDRAALIGCIGTVVNLFADTAKSAAPSYACRRAGITTTTGFGSSEIAFEE